MLKPVSAARSYDIDTLSLTVKPSRLTLAFLCLVGLLYVGLGVFCSVRPDEASKTVGFTLNGGAGSSEFLTVYGGLEIGLGLTFLIPLLRTRFTEFSLVSCLVVHVAIVACRTLSFALFADVGTGTVKLAVGETIILLLTIVCWFTELRREKRPSAD